MLVNMEEDNWEVSHLTEELKVASGLEIEETVNGVLTYD